MNALLARLGGLLRVNFPIKQSIFMVNSLFVDQSVYWIFALIILLVVIQLWRGFSWYVVPIFLPIFWFFLVQHFSEGKIF